MNLFIDQKYNQEIISKTNQKKKFQKFKSLQKVFKISPILLFILKMTF